jgi:hypothetical protein
LLKEQKRRNIYLTHTKNVLSRFDHSIVSKKKDIPGADSLLFLPDSARANLVDMGHCVDQEMANSQRGTDLETKAAMQSHYIEWTRIMGIPDPCGPHKGYQRIVAIYTKYIQSSINYYNNNNLGSATLHGYAAAVNTLELRKHSSPIKFNDKNNMARVIINNIIKEENIAKQCAPLNRSVFAKIQQMAQKSNNSDSDHCLFANIVTLA